MWKQRYFLIDLKWTVLSGYFNMYVLLHYFDLKKTAAEAYLLIFQTYDEQTLSERTCGDWFKQFRSGDFSVKDKRRLAQPKKFEDAELQTLLDKNLTQTLEKLSKVLIVTPMAAKKVISSQ